MCFVAHMFQPCAFPHLLDALVIDRRQTKPLTCTSCAMLSLQRSLFNPPDYFFSRIKWISLSQILYFRLRCGQQWSVRHKADSCHTIVREAGILHDFGLKKHKFITNIIKTNLELLTWTSWPDGRDEFKNLFSGSCSPRVKRKSSRCSNWPR